MSYLRQYQQAQKDFEAFWDEIPENSKSLIFGSYDITYKKRDSIEQVKYGTLCRFDESWQHACRGTTIVHLPEENPEIVYSLNKFFNLGELEIKFGQNPHDMMKQMEDDGFQLVMTYKEDGTNIKTFYDSNGNVHSMTLGSVDPTVKMQSKIPDSPTFSGLSLELLRRDYPELMNYLKEHPYVALISELESPWNVIVTKYSTTRIVPLCLIERDGLPKWSSLHKLLPTRFTPFPVGSRPTSARTFEADMIDYFRFLESNPNEFGHNPEGFVLYAYRDGVCLPWAKGKRPQYLEDHRQVSLIIGSAQDFKIVQIQVLKGEFDDEIGVGSSIRTQHALQFMNFLQQRHQEFLPVAERLRLATSPKEIATIVQQLPKWLQKSIFSLKGQSIDHPSEFLVSSLLDQIDKIHQQSGDMWFLPSNSPTTSEKSKFLVISDFDGTLIRFNSNPLTIPTDPEWIIPSLNLLRGYHQLGARIVVITGRQASLSVEIQNLLHDELGFEIPVYGCPDGTKISLHKAQVLNQLRGEAETVVHLEDDLSILQSNLDRLTRIRYLGIQVIQGELAEIVSNSRSRVIVSLVQPPGSGKTTILRKIQDHYRHRRTSYLSTDVFHRECRQLMKIPEGEKVPGEMIYRHIVRSFARACNESDLILIDMCHDKSDMLKSIEKSNCKTVIRTFMQLVSVRAKNGKLKTDLDPQLRMVYQQRAHDRLSGNTETTLTDESKIDDVIDRKIQGCVQQVLNRQIPQLPLGTIEEMVSTLISEIDGQLGNSTIREHPMAYIGVPVEVPSISDRDGFRRVEYPHVTIEAPSTQLTLSNLGQKFSLMIGELYHGENTSFHPVSGGRHITRLVRNGFAAKNAQEERLHIETPIISEVVGYSVLM